MPTDPPFQHPHLQQLSADLDAVTDAADALFDGLSETQLAWRPSPDVWSLAEIFQHLVATATEYEPKLRGAVERARQVGAPMAPYRPTLFGRTFIGFMRPGTRWKMRTVRAFRPDGAPPEGVPERFRATQDTLQTLVRAADAVNVNTGKFASPVTGLIRLTLGEGLTLLTVHEQRHLAQARRLRDHPDFPSR